MTEPSPTKTFPVRLSLKRGAVAEGVVEDGTVETMSAEIEETVESSGPASAAGSDTAAKTQAVPAGAVPAGAGAKAVGSKAVGSKGSPPAAGAEAAAATGAGRASSSIPPSGPKPVASRPAAQKPGASTGPRRVRLSVSRVDPWSVMKLGFLLSVALGIMTVVAAAVAWNVVDSMGVFSDLESLLSDLGAIEQFGVIMEYLRLKNIMSMAVVVSIVNVALITALATLGAFIYNVVAALVGGLHVTLTDD